MSDLIRRGDVLGYISRLNGCGLGKVKSLEYIRKYVERLPSADRPQGEWIEVTNGRGGHECSNCHAYAPSYMSGDEHLSVFCPNCGARMKGVRK